MAEQTGNPADATPLVTVIVCVYNGDAFLLPSVESILAQTYRNLEVIVVDDGSTDGCMATLERVDDPRLRVLVHRSNEGKSVALNTALANSRAEFFAVQDADDISAPDRIQKQVEHLLANPDLAAVFCGHDLILGSERVAPRTRHLDRTACRRAIARMTLPALDPTAMYRRALVADLEFDPDLRIAQGLDYILRVGEKYPLEVLGECLYSYRILQSSRTKRDANKRRDFVHSVCASACERRGLPKTYASRFYEDDASLGHNRVLDNNVAAHFIESSLDLKREGHAYRAATTALRCSSLRFLDRHYHKALLYSFLPLGVVSQVRRSVTESAIAPLPAELRPESDVVFDARAVSDMLLETSRSMRICLFGAAGDTGNLGVSALMHSALGGIARSAPDSRVTVFDNGWGLREAEAFVQGRAFPYWRCGARMSRRYHRPESFANMRVASMFGGLANQGARAILHSDAVWDVSGGDSFGDIYGERHLRGILEPKRFALRTGRPLVLLPQTYGPFSRNETRAAAADVVCRSELAWARDERSFTALKALAGDRFDPKRHRAGVDMAFALDTYRPVQRLEERLEDWFADDGPPVIGINVSGLIYNDPEAPRKFGLRIDYAEFMRSLIARFLRETDARIVLVSHVIPTDVHAESDIVAARAAFAEVAEADRERIVVSPEGLDQSETKWLIAHLDWFCGTRMHACIGAMSSRVPATGLAYSLKYRGVFEMCGLGDAMADMRRLDPDGVMRRVWQSWEERAAWKRTLDEHIPSVKTRALEELRETVEFTASLL